MGCKLYLFNFNLKIDSVKRILRAIQDEETLLWPDTGSHVFSILFYLYSESVAILICYVKIQRCTRNFALLV